MHTTDTSDLPRPTLVPAAPGRFFRLAVIIVGILALNMAGSWLASQLNFQIWPHHSDVIEILIFAVVIAFVFAMAAPFVPGIEIGLALMLFLGPGGIVLVYLCTQLALALSFLSGRLIPLRFLARFFGWLQFAKARRLVHDLQSIAPHERIDALAQRAPAGCATFLVQHRHLALAVALNLPGNAVIGGAGGIAMIAGMTRVCSLPWFALLMAFSTLPVPLFLLLAGTN